MVTERELRDVLTEAVDDPAAEQYLLGLSDRALLAARGRGGRGARTWRRYVPGVAVGTAFVVAGTFGVLALAGGSGDGGRGGKVTEMNAPTGVPNAVARSALVDFEVECFDGRGPKLAMDYVWDPEAQQYRAIDGEKAVTFTPSPDGKLALVKQGTNTKVWAVADWDDAIADRVTYHEADDGGVLWTADGKALISAMTWVNGPDKSPRLVLSNKTVDFYDPGTGGKRSVPIPQAVLDRVAGGQWLLQQWQADHDAPVFPMVNLTGDRIEWLDAGGKVARTLTVQNGLGADPRADNPYLQIAISPDNRYLAESNGTNIATFDLQAGGRRIAVSPSTMDPARWSYAGWTADDQITLAVDTSMVDSAKPGWKQPKTGHSPVYRVYGPDLKLIEEARFVLPADPQGYCASWPITWAPKTQFPGAFVP
ncbi:MAG: hypothetical protein HOV83_39445 [Catenulispora sp.]|nr:hypothetical protein [Catenulispora sp.]